MERRKIACPLLLAVGSLLFGFGCANQRHSDPRADAARVQTDLQAFTAREEETATKTVDAQRRLNGIAGEQTANAKSLASAMQEVRDLQAKGVSLETQRRQTENYLASLSDQSVYDRGRIAQLQRELNAINAVINEQERRDLDKTMR